MFAWWDRQLIPPKTSQFWTLSIYAWINSSEIFRSFNLSSATGSNQSQSSSVGHVSYNYGIQLQIS